MLARPGWNRSYRSYRRRRDLSGTTVFMLLIVVVSLEAGWWLQPFWRGLLVTTVVLAEVSPASDASSAANTTPMLLDRAEDALILGRWPEAGAAFDRAIEVDPAPPTAQ